MKIAIIGSGISGNAAAWALAGDHDVTVYEKRNRLGGHSATVDIDYDGNPITVDTGFIVYNETNYPNLTRLFEHLDVPTKDSNMTFSVSLDGGNLEWCGSRLTGIFAQRRNLLSPGFLRMLGDIARFNLRARKDLKSGALCGLTLNDYLHQAGFSHRLKNDYLVPMTSAIWSTPTTKMLEFPAESLIQFMKNHALIQYKRPRWRTVSGGSREYVKRLCDDTPARFRLNCGVNRLRRTSQGVEITAANGHIEVYDKVVLAVHTDQALRMIDDPTDQEFNILSSIKYTSNDVWLHRDLSLMPKRKNAWASWNYIGERNAKNDREVSVTYWMNSLQGIDRRHPLFITLNPLHEPAPNLTFHKFNYAHPMFDSEAVAAQSAIPGIQGANGLYFCGAWCGFGFHEDGLKSGLDVAKLIGSRVPWDVKPKIIPDAETYPLAIAAE